jgi:hypothetical protein
MDIYNSTLATHQVTYVHMYVRACVRGRTRICLLCYSRHTLKFFHHAQYHNRDRALICVSRPCSSACYAHAFVHKRNRHDGETYALADICFKAGTVQPRSSLCKLSSMLDFWNYDRDLLEVRRHADLPIAMFRTESQTCEVFPWRVYATTESCSKQGDGGIWCCEGGGGIFACREYLRAWNICVHGIFAQIHFSCMEYSQIHFSSIPRVVGTFHFSVSCHIACCLVQLEGFSRGLASV